MVDVDVRALDWHAAAKSIGCALRRPTPGVDDPRSWPLALPVTLDDAIVGELRGVAVVAYCRREEITRESFDDRRSAVVGAYFVHSVRTVFRASLGVGLVARTAWPPADEVRFESFRAHDTSYANAVLGRAGDGPSTRALDALEQILRCGFGRVELGIDDEGIWCIVTGGTPPLHASPARLAWLMDEVAAATSRIERAQATLPMSPWTERIRSAWGALASSRGLVLAPGKLALHGSAPRGPVRVEADPCRDETRFVVGVPVDTLVTMHARESPAASPRAIAVRTGNDEFDERFWVEGDRNFASCLGPTLQQALLDVWPATTRTGDGTRGVTLARGRLEIVLPRLVDRADELEAMLARLLEIVSLFAGETKPTPTGPYR
jgi:hypothetical protein